MTTVERLDSESHGTVTPLPAKEKSRQLPRRTRWLVMGVSLALVFSAGIAAFFYNRLNSAPNLGELPPIPAVNLEGVDPAIVKLVKEVREILETSPHRGVLWGQYAMVLHAHGFDDAAHIGYDAAASLEPKSPIWPYLHGELCAGGHGGPEAAQPHFELAAKLSAPDPMARLRLADTLLEMGRLDEAEQEYRRVLESESQDPQAQLGLGQVAVARRQYQKAVEYLQPAAKHPRVQRSATALLANVQDRLGDRDSADRTRARLAKLPPDEPRFDDPLQQVTRLEVGLRADLAHAQKLMEQRDIADLVKLLEGVVYRYPDSFEAWSALSNACGMSGDATGAERASRRATQLAPKNSVAWLSLANVLIWQGRNRDALEPLQKSIALNPKNRLAYRSLGQCRKNLGDAKGAAEAFRLSEMEDAPSHEPASSEKGS